MLNFFPYAYLVQFQKFCHLFCLLLFTVIFNIQNITAEEISTESLIAANTSLSNQAALKFKHLLTTEGLSQNNVFDIVQDHDGFIWIATEDGLNRYDGNNFVHYRKNLEDPNSIANNFIRKVFIDKDGVLWAGTEKGLSKYNVVLDNFENFHHEDGNNDSLKDDTIWDIYQDKTNNIWVSTTNGIHKFDQDNNHFRQIKIHGLEDELKEIKTIHQDLKGNFWFGSYDNGIFLVNENLNYAESLQKKNNKFRITIPAKSLFDIKEINGDYWLGTDKGIYVLDENYNQIDSYNTTHLKNKLISNYVRSIVLSDDSTVWVGTENGLNIIDPRSRSISSFQNSQQSNSISENNIHRIIKDITGNLWLATYGKGVNIFFNDSLHFKHYSNGVIGGYINLFAETTDGKVWFNDMNSGINYMGNNISGNYIKATESADIYHIKADNKNNLWVNTSTNELFIYDISSKEAIKVKEWKENSLYDNDYPFQIFNGEVWFIDMNGGLVSFSISTNEFSRYNVDDNKRLKTFDIDSQNNTIWATSTENQLISFDLSIAPHNENNFNYHNIQGIKYLSTTEVTSLKVSESWVWLTSNQGVLLYNKSTKATTYFNENNELLNHSIESVLLDKKENAWLSTNGAISVITPSTQKVKNLSKDLHLSDIEFIASSALKTIHDEFYFGSSNGVYKFSPQKAIKIRQVLSSPKLTNLLEIWADKTPKNCLSRISS